MKKNIIIIILIIIDIGFFLFAYAQMAITKHQKNLTIHQWEIAKQSKAAADSAKQKVMILQKIIDQQNTLISELKIISNSKKPN